MFYNRPHGKKCTEETIAWKFTQITHRGVAHETPNSFDEGTFS